MTALRLDQLCAQLVRASPTVRRRALAQHRRLVRRGAHLPVDPRLGHRASAPICGLPRFFRSATVVAGRVVHVES